MRDHIITKEHIVSFSEHLLFEEKSISTQKKYLRDVQAFCAFSNGAAVTKELLIGYKQSLLHREYAVQSINSMLASVNAFFRFLGWMELCVKQLKVQKKAYCSEETELTKGEYQRLLNVADERLSLVIQTLCGSGIRVSELQYITVEAVQAGEAVVHCKGKTRTVFLVSNLRKKLLRYAKCKGIHTGPVFVTKSGKPLDRSNIWRAMKALCAQAGVAEKKVFPHNLRHLFARTFYNLEKDIAKLADILGHASINTTRIYIISTGAEHKRRMEQMHLIV